LDIAVHATSITSNAEQFRALSSRSSLAALGWLPGNNCSAPPPLGAPDAATWGCAAEYATYKSDLELQISAVTAALGRFTSAVTAADEFAAKLRTNVTALRLGIDAANTRLAAAAFAQAILVKSLLTTGWRRPTGCLSL